jgi:GNAT superfamily N-acetyltransferase
VEVIEPIAAPSVARIRPARIEEASELSELCVRSKAVWGYDETFMALTRAALEVRPEHIDAGDVWVATAADGSIAGIVALGPGDQPRTLDLDKLFVAPQRIRSGVGRMLLAQAMAEARRRGAWRLMQRLDAEPPFEMCSPNTDITRPCHLQMSLLVG